MSTPHTPGVFELLQEFRSYEIQSWLDTTPPNVARGLFETGAKLEQERRELLAALKSIVAQFEDDPDDLEHFDACEKIARAALAKAGGES